MAGRNTAIHPELKVRNRRLQKPVLRQKQGILSQIDSNSISENHNMKHEKAGIHHSGFSSHGER
jgi:hypothetical protein